MEMINLVSARFADVPRRPLLFAAGAAATAASLYCYYVKRGDREKNTENLEDTTTHEDLVCKQATDPALVRSTEVLQDQMTVAEAEKIQKVLVFDTQLEDRLRTVEELLCEAQCILQAEKDDREKTLIYKEELLKVSLAEAEEKHHKSVETITQLEEEKSNLTNQVERLRENGEDMKNNFCMAYSERDELMNELVREQKAYSVLQSNYIKIEKTLLDREKILKVSLFKAKKQHRHAVETMTQMEEEKFNLTNQVKELSGTLENMKNNHFKINKERDELMDKCVREQVAYSILQVENDEMKKTLIHQEELLKVSLAEAEEKHQTSVETITQLEEEKSKLTNQVERLSQNVEDIKNNLFKAYCEHDELMKECVRERKVYSALQSDYNMIQKTLLYQDKFLKAALAEAKEKHQNAAETITQLEMDKSKLTNQMEELRETLENLKNDLYKSNSERDELMDVNEELLAECLREREAYRVLQFNYIKIEKTLLHQDKFLMVSLAEAKEKHQKAVETITQLEKDKYKLTNHLESLRGTVEDMKAELFETHKECDELMDSVQQQEAHSVLQPETLEMMPKEEIQKVSLAENETPGAYGDHCSCSMIQV